MTHSIWRTGVTVPYHEDTDIVIIGAGIAGLSVAYWLKTLAPKIRVTVVDQKEVGQGASGRNAGFNTAGSAFYLSQLIEKVGLTEAQKFWDFKQESLRLMREHLFAKFEAQQSFRGSATVFHDQALLDKVSANLKDFKNFAPVSSQELERQGMKGLVGGLCSEFDGSLHPLMLLQEMHQWLGAQGVRFVFNQSAGWVDGNTLILENGEIKAPLFFLCTNGYAGQFHDELKALVFPKRAQMIALEASQLKLTGNFYDPAHKVYFRQTPEGELLIGGLRTIDEATENSDYDRLNRTIQMALEAYVVETFQQSFAVSRRWSGIMGFTAEERPLIHAIPNQPVVFVGGFSGHGMGLAFGVAHSAVSRFLGAASSLP